MKKLVILAIVVALIIAFALPGSLFAHPGAPAAHGVDGLTFGGLVAGWALGTPLELADHVRGVADHVRR